MEKVRIYYILNRGLSSDDLIRRCASHFCGVDCSGMEIIRERGKKPFFASGEPCFSVSHSGDLWVCVFAWHEVGCDVQEMRANDKYKRLAARWFCESEAERTVTERDFYDIWSRKEAYVKFLGIGINEEFRRFDSFAPSGALIRDFTVPGGEKRYSAAAAMREDFIIETFDFNQIG
ncbi:MAG: 4'-phosphopantetheinyl transferase superfamily protein [Clostridia bacterium]|nr:4'-phosphopantetheinyl transferase superfamily protein [Clostridia bacterium]